MSILNLVKVAAVSFAVGAAVGGGYAAVIKIRKTRAAEAAARENAHREFDEVIEANLRKAGGEELVMQYRFEVARRTGKI